MAAGKPRLLLVEPDADPPITTDPYEDWVRLPAHERDIAARVLGLSGRLSPPKPLVDENNRLLFSGQWVALSPIEARMAAVLVEQFGTVVSTQEICDRGWEGICEPDKPSETALRVHLTRLRKRIAPLGLELRTVRLKGSVLQSR